MKAGITQCIFLYISLISLDVCKGRTMSGLKTFSARRYHTFLRHLAIINEEMKHHRHRLSRNRVAGGISHRETKRSSQFYNPEILKVHGDTKCPSMSDIITEQSFLVCPAYSVTEYDENRIPLVIFQVHCKCFGCHGPFHGHRHKCAPIFKFINAYRVVNKTVTGENIYTKVREPVSYGCKCKKDSFGLRHTYMYMPP